MNDKLESNTARPLPPERLRWRCAFERPGFQTTDELEDLYEIVGQPRALDAVSFAVGIRHSGYNVFVLGPPGIGKRSLVQQIVERQAVREPAPPDWCYVHSFRQPQKPQLLKLPAGRGEGLRLDVEQLVDELQAAILAAIEVEEHQNRVEQIEQDARQQHEEAIAQFAAKSQSQGIQLVRTPGGFALAPMRDGEVLSPEDFSKLSEAEQRQIEAVVASLQEELHELVQRVPQRRKEVRDKIKALNREVTSLAIRQTMQPIFQKYSDLAQVVAYLEAFQQDVMQRADEFRPVEGSAEVRGCSLHEHPVFARYSINVLVDNGNTRGAPLIYEDHPSYQNLLGRIEHKSFMGALVTDFTLIKPGALHRANGGYLIIDARRLLQQPYAWEGLKRALCSERIKIESLAETLSLVSTVSLEPEPVPLNVKVVLLGDRLLYYLIYEYDADFAELFKVAADFEDTIAKTPSICMLYARLIATLLRRDALHPFDASGVARIIEQGVRIAGDSEKITTNVSGLSDLLREADFWAREDRQEVVRAEHVQRAIDSQIRRADRLRERLQEEIQRGLLLVDTSGFHVGQLNGLSVYELGNFRFGRPSRITATSRFGRGEVVDIEREVELGGAVHSKGVLILSAFLAARYAKNHPLSLSATLVFEQSYGLVDGDSASVAELCALLSSLADIPIRQSLAVTGSVNQRGQVQPIGGVNEKIEGFFDTCEARGLTGNEGVVIPAANVKHLMLKSAVVEAAARGQFHIYPIETIDEAIALLTGMPAGTLGKDGVYPQETVNACVAGRLYEMFQLQQRFGAERERHAKDD